MGKKTDNPETNNASSGAEEEEEEYAVEKILDRRVRKGKVCTGKSVSSGRLGHLANDHSHFKGGILSQMEGLCRN